MFARYPGIPWNLPAVCAAVLLMAALSLPAGSAHGFGLKLTWEDGVKAATDDLNALGEQDPEGRKKTTAQQRLEREFDRMTGNAAGKAADKIEEYTLKAGKKAYGWLERTKSFGSVAKKLARTYGPVVKKGLRLSPLVGKAVVAWDLGYAVGSKIIAPTIAIPLIERHFDNKWEKQQAELSREIADLRSRGEERRQWQERKNDFASLIAGAIAVRKLTAGGPWAQDTTEDSNPAGSGKTAWDAETSGAGEDPWSAESSDVRFARPIAVKTAPAPVKEIETGPSNYEKALNSLQSGGARSAGYKGALEKLETDRRAEQARREAEAQAARQRQAAPAPVKDIETGPSNYEKALNSLEGSGTRSAGYKGTLEKLEADRRAEQARREAEAQAARQRQAARAAEARRDQAARDAAARRAAAARETDTQQALERARREQREYSKRSYNNSLQQLNRNLQMLQQTRQRQQRAYQRQKALDLQRQRQRRLEQARRQQIYEQQRERDRQTYQPYSGRGGSSSNPGGDDRCPPGMFIPCRGPCVPIAGYRGGVC